MKSSTGPGPQLLKGYFKTDNITIIHQVRSRLYTNQKCKSAITIIMHNGVKAILNLHMNYQRFGEIFSKLLILIIKIVKVEIIEFFHCAQQKNSNFRNFCWMIRTQPISLLKLFLLYMEQWEDKKAICHKFPGFEIQLILNS